MDALFSLYSRSPKTQRRQEFEALQLDIQLKKIGRVLNTRWVASSFRTVRAAWDNFEALEISKEKPGRKITEALTSRDSLLIFP